MCLVGSANLLCVAVRTKVRKRCRGCKSTDPAVRNEALDNISPNPKHPPVSLADARMQPFLTLNLQLLAERERPAQ
jgi:hypothetical protein